jgi:hypothetical protein
VSNEQRGTVIVVRRLISGIEGTWEWEGNCVKCDWCGEAEGFAHDSTETKFMRKVAKHSRTHDNGG